MTTTAPSTPTKVLKGIVPLTPPTDCDEPFYTKPEKDSQAAVGNASEKTTGVDVLVPNEATPVTKNLVQVSKQDIVIISEEVESVKLKEKDSAYPTPPASPVLQTVKFKSASKLQPGIKDAENLASYKATSKKTFLSTDIITAKLNIEKWLCGNKKGNGQPCGWWSTLKSEHRRIEVQNLVHELSLIEVNSLAFDLALKKLAQSYSCHHHNKGSFLEYRLGQWKNTLVPVTEAESQLHTVLWSISKSCVECGKAIGGQRVENCQKTSKLILNHKGDLKYYEYLLRVWDANTRCNNHFNLSNETRVKEMVERIQKIVTFSTGSPSMLVDIRYFWPTKRTTTAFEAIHQWIDPTGETDSLMVMESQVKERLEGEDFDNGIVYLYEVDGNPGLVKIGYTGRTLETRRTEMEFRCNRDCRILYSCKVPNAKRVEALCHADLHDCRVQVACDGCIVYHNEWFRASLSEARAVVNKWATWINSHPYETRSLRSRDLGFLKDSARLKDMAKFKRDPTGMRE